MWFHVLDDPNSDNDILFFKSEDVDALSLIFREESLTNNGDYRKLYKTRLKEYIQSICPTVSITDQCVGNIYERIFLDFGLMNFGVGDLFRANDVIYRGSPRPTKPDAVANADGIYPVQLLTPYVIIDGRWFEVKATFDNWINLSYDGYQIRGHYDNLAVHIGAFNVSTDISQMYFITTADTGVSFDVFEYGNSYQTINTEHIWGYYKMNDNGQMEINFALWNDWSPVHWITGPLFLKTNLPVVVDSRYCTYCTRP